MQFKQLRKDSLKIIWAWKGIGTHDACNNSAVLYQTELSRQMGDGQFVSLQYTLEDKDITCVCNCYDLSREIKKFHIFPFISRYTHAHICVVNFMAPAALSAKSVIKYSLNTINFLRVFEYIGVVFVNQFHA